MREDFPESQREPLAISVPLCLLQHLAQCLEHSRRMKERGNGHNISEYLSVEALRQNPVYIPVNSTELPNSNDKTELLVPAPQGQERLTFSR